MVLLSGRWLGAVQLSKEGQTTAADSAGQERLPSTRAYLVIGDKFWPMDIQNPPKAKAVRSVNLLWYTTVADHVSALYRNTDSIHVL